MGKKKRPWKQDVFSIKQDDQREENEWLRSRRFNGKPCCINSKPPGNRMPVEHLKEPPLVISHHPLLSLALTLTGIICRDQGGSYLLQKTNPKIRINSYGGGPCALPLRLLHPPPSSAILPPHPVQTGLGPVPRNKCCLALQSSWKTNYPIQAGSR